MTPRFALVFRGLYLCLLRSASMLVPRRQRAEWWKEWRSELWHVRQACAPDASGSLRGEQEVAAFCMGAFQDAYCLRCDLRRERVPLATTKGSASQCMLFLTSVTVASCGIALLLPGVRAELQPSRYRIAPGLVLIQSARSALDSVPTISAEQFQVWELRRQHIFDGFAFYRVVREPVSTASRGQTTLGIAHASLNLFELLGLSMRSPLSDGQTRDNVPRIVLSDGVWRLDFGGDPNIVGHRVTVGSLQATVVGVATPGSWRLPGKVDAWLLGPNVETGSGDAGYVVARLMSSEASNLWSEKGHLKAPTPDGSLDDFLCVSLAERTRGPQDIFLFAVILACLALPATTSLPLGEYRQSSHKLSWSTRLRRWSFLLCKLALLLPIVYFVSLDLAYLRITFDTFTSEYIQLVSSFSICLFGLRWVLRDQRQRCPVCLGKLSHPAKVGQPSRTFLAWNGIELICVGGHGLLHVPEMPTSWFSTQRWLYLDPSWEILFAEPTVVSTGYF